MTQDARHKGRASLVSFYGGLERPGDTTPATHRQDWWPIAAPAIAARFNLTPAVAAVVADLAGYGGGNA